MILYHGSNLLVTEPEIRKTKYTKDFGWGFYTTEIRRQAEQWAIRRAQNFGGVPTVSSFIYEENPELSIRIFQSPDEEWLDFIAFCRGGNVHSYDIVKGPMADDVIWDYVRDYLDGNISKAAFMELAKFRKPTQQTTFHTQRALATLTYLDGVTL